MNQDQAKRAAAEAALKYVVPGEALGVGTGSTVNFFIDGFFSTWLITPPVEPRPNSIADGPIRISICSRLKTSR